MSLKLKNMLIYKTGKTLNTPKNTAATTATMANKAAQKWLQTAAEWRAKTTSKQNKIKRRRDHKSR